MKNTGESLLELMLKLKQLGEENTEFSLKEAITFVESELNISKISGNRTCIN